VKFEQVPWKLSLGGVEQESPESVLKSFLKPDPELPVSLGLSGGLDSRVLLSLLSQQAEQPFSVHTFGEREDPDVAIALRIAAHENFEHKYFHDPIPPADDCVRAMKEYVRQTCVIEPVSSFLKLRYYGNLHTMKRIVIDGGLGEIGRRQYFNRLLVFGRDALLRGDVQAVVPLISRGRARIFHDDLSRQMQTSAEKHLEKLLHERPGIDEIGAENFLDLLVIRTRLPNWAAYEQSRTDGLVVSYMPFAQPSFLRQLFQIPVDLKRNGRLFRMIIQNNYPQLSRYPLVKSGSVYPYRSRSFTAAVRTKLSSTLGISYHDPTAKKLLHKISDFVQDTVRSVQTRSYGGYNSRKIEKMVEEFYKGKEGLAHQIDWWLSFELWRESLGGSIKN
jgi:hypothetical protein